MSPCPALTRKIWFDGRLIPWEQATVHVTTHALHYGSSVFEGIRVYSTPNGPAALGLRQHISRFLRSARIFRMDLGYSADQLSDAVLDTVSANGHESAYVRPLSIRGAGALGPYVPNNPVHTIILTQELGRVLGADSQEVGIDVAVSSWRRMALDTHPAMAKIGGNYVVTQLMAHEARARGFTEAIALDINGAVSETGGANIFLVQDGELYTPSLGESILGGITRGFIMRLAADRGLTLKEQRIPRELLYTADEVFLTGTAVEITPIRSIDDVRVGNGQRGPITAALQKDFFDIVHGCVPDRHDWLTPIGIRNREDDSLSLAGAVGKDEALVSYGSDSATRVS